MPDRHVLVIGGQRSGKSRYAEGLVLGSGLKRVYVATATAGDAEMAERIAGHRARRDAGWTTVEAPLDLAGAVARESTADTVVLVECLTLWLSNLMGAGRDVAAETDRLLEALADASGPVVLVGNEVGSGIVPADAFTRAYADALGTLNRTVAEAVGRVVLVAAGQPIRIKPPLQPETNL